MFKQGKKIVELTDEQCFSIAQIVTDGIMESLSRVDRSPNIDRVEIFCDDTTEKIDIMRFNRINWLENHSGKWQSICIYNYVRLFEYLYDEGFIVIE